MGSLVNQGFFEKNDVVNLILNQDANSDVTSDVIKVSDYERAYVVLTKPAGTAGDDLSIAMYQSVDASNTSGKALTFEKIWHKVGATALTATAAWTAVTLTTATADLDLVAVNSTDLVTDTNAAMVAVEIPTDTLDHANGFDYITLFIEGDDIGNALTISAEVILCNRRHASDVPPNVIA